MTLHCKRAANDYCSRTQNNEAFTRRLKIVIACCTPAVERTGEFGTLRLIPPLASRNARRFTKLYFWTRIGLADYHPVTCENIVLENKL